MAQTSGKSRINFKKMKTKQERILEKIEANKEISKALKGELYYNTEQFINDANRYIKAIKERRVICSIGSVSASGMSRTIKFLAPERGSSGYNYLNFFAFMRILGFTPANKNDHYFRIGGCGMDMIFHTNYTIIHRLQRLGFISKKQCEVLAQNTPCTI